MRLTLCFLLLFFGQCFAKEFSKIEVYGNKRLSKDTILSDIELLKNQQFTDQELNQQFKDLYATDLFSDLHFNLEEDVLKITIKENPILSTISVKGNKFASSSDIKKALELKEDSVLTDAKLQKGLQNVSMLYKVKGRSGTTVDFIKKQNSAGGIDLVVNIKESKSLKIAKIRFFGNSKFMDFDLKKVVSSKEFSILRILGSSYYYVEERLPMDAESLRYFYQSNGYFDFIIKDIKQRQEGDKIFLDFYLQEGIQYKVGGIKINTKIRGVEEDDIKKYLHIRSESVFSVDRANRESNRIIEKLNEEGYLFVNVNPEYKTRGDYVDITFNVLDAKKMYIGKIDIKGNKRTRDHVIRRELLIAERDVYSRNKINLSRRNLFGLGFFDEIDFQNIQDSDQSIDIDLNVKERTTGYINLSGGYASDTGIFGNLSFTESNLLGTGNKIGLSLKRSLRDFDGSFDFTKTRLFDTKISGQISVFYTTSDKKGESSYKIGTAGFRVGIDYSLTDNLYNNLFYSFKSTNIYDLDNDASDSIKEQAGRNDISMVGYSFVYSTLNNHFAPKNGFFGRFNQGFSGIGGDLNFVRSEYKLSYFKDLKETKRGDIILNISTKGGHIFGYSGQDVLVGQRFFLSDVRGFENAGIGPRDKNNNDALGGNTFILNTAQMEFPSGLPREFDVKGSIFFDNAVLTDVDGYDPDSMNDSKNFRNSVGIGIIWGSPFGRIKIDFGWPITKEQFDKTKVLKFGIMTPTS